ncbi:MAG: HDOD domain-containing protein [Candidatus Tectomicrobia bacterium]
MTDYDLTSGAATESESLEAALLERIEGGQVELPVLPDVIWQVMELSASEDADARKLSALIHRDPALASHMLRVANSPAYMSRMPIVSLQQAVSRLGIRQISEIAFAFSLQSRLFEAPGYEQEIRTLWHHSVGTAVYASEIARLLRRNVEGAFLCGLLHDIGKAVIMQLLIDIQNQEALMLVPTALDAIVEVQHNHVGSLLARQWSLPEHVHESILLHHNSSISPDCSELVFVTQLADQLSYHMMTPEHVDAESVSNHPVLEILNLYPDDVANLIEKRDKIQSIVEAMS